VDPHLERLQEELASAVRGLSTRQLSWHPAGKWCTVEIVEHLYLSYTGTSKALGRILESGQPQAKVPSVKQRVQAFILVSLGYFPTGRESPAAVRPKGAATEKIVDEVGPKIAEMDAVMAKCAAKFGVDQKVLDHPILGPLSISQWRKFHLVHGLHHVKQIRHLRDLAV